jgi:hypothetical protein
MKVELIPVFGRRPSGSPFARWPLVIGVVVLCLYVLVSHGCHGDADHELSIAPQGRPAHESGE